MSILIKGATMPSSCIRCFAFSGQGCKISRVLFSDITNIAARVKECPLVELPPHGRLIDADALYAVMKKERDRISKDYGDNDEYVQCLTKYAMSMVLSAPTILEAEGKE